MFEEWTYIPLSSRYMYWHIHRYRYRRGPIRDFLIRARFALSEPRRSIINILSDDVKSTNEIYKELRKRGLSIPRSVLYYHLSSLRELGIIEMAGYREGNGGAPEKTWRLKVKRIGINIVTGEVFVE